MQIEKIRYYLDGSVTKSKYIGGMFVGSNDEITWTLIHEIKDTPHPRWNTANNDCSPLGFATYRYVKWQPSTSDLTACNFLEIEFTGKLVYNADTPDFSCDVELFTTSNILMDKQSNGVTYSSDSTPKVTSLSKDFIDWKGGETLNIYGNGFGTVKEDVAVAIDGVACVVAATTDSHI